MGSSCPLGISGVGPSRKSSILGYIINPLLTKHVRSKGLCIGLILLCVFIDLDFVSVKKKEKRENELAQHPSILTSGLVNNSYLSSAFRSVACEVPRLTLALFFTACHFLMLFYVYVFTGFG